jgi:hypothetical protein
MSDDERFTLDRAANLLLQYADYLREVRPDDIERQPHLPELEMTAEVLRALAARTSGDGCGSRGPNIPPSSRAHSNRTSGPESRVTNYQRKEDTMIIPITLIGDGAELYEIDGRSYTGQQLRDALSVCFDMAVSYAMADPENGGDHHIEWEWLDSVAERADRVMVDRMHEVVHAARDNNDFVPDDTDQDGADEPGPSVFAAIGESA